MTDVTKVRAMQVYAPTKGVHANRESAFHLMRQLLALQGVTTVHHKEQLSIALWKWTEAEGLAPNAKYNTRYVSRGVREGVSPTRINHEHVWTRKHLIQRLLARHWDDDALRGFLVNYGVSCIVTVEEHAHLGAARGEGWQRYSQAGVAVFDRQEQAWLDLGSVGPTTATGAVAELGSRETTPGQVREADIGDLMRSMSKPAAADQLLELVRTGRFAQGVAVPSYKADGRTAAYFRIHDTLIGEPTAAAAYPHWSGKVDFRLDHDDVPEALRDDPSLRLLNAKGYRVSCKVTDAASRRVAEDLLFIALERLRADYEAGLATQ